MGMLGERYMNGPVKKVGEFTFPEGGIVVRSGETLNIDQSIKLDEAGEVVEHKVVAVEVEGKPETRREYNYDE